MGNIGKDILFAGRVLARSPGYAALVVATLGLGIGANTAIFSIVDGVLLQPLPFRDADRLSVVWQKSASGPQLGVSEVDLDDYRGRTRAFDDLAAFTAPGTKSAILKTAGSSIDISPSYVTESYFPVLGTSPLRGRDFLPQESRRGNNQVAILSYSFWQSQFGGSPDILNRQITLNKQALEVVGIMGPDVYPVDADVFLPFTQLHPSSAMPRNYHELTVIGRLRPGVRVKDAQSEVQAISRENERAYPATNAGISAYLSPLRDEITGPIRESILLLAASVALVLLIACANVANLILLRMASRQKELAIRIALGARRSRITAQFAVEVALLSTLGAVFGLLVASASMPIIGALGQTRIPRIQHVAINSRALLFTLALSVVCVVICGSFPAWRSSALDVHQNLRSVGRTSYGASGGYRNALVIGEVALAVVVVVAAGLLVRSINKLLAVDPGFRTDHLLVAQISLPRNYYKQPAVEGFYKRLLPRIASIPGISSVATTTTLPISSALPQTRFSIQGHPAPEPGKYPVAVMATVDTGFFKTMEIPIQSGRDFQVEEMGEGGEEKCIVSATLVRTYLAGRNPLGQIILTNVAAENPEPCRIVGVAGDTRFAGLDSPPRPMLYFASYAAKESLVIRTTVDPLSIASALRGVAADVDREQPVSKIRSMDQVLSQSLSRRSFAAVLLSMFSALALVLAALGLYGVVSYSVAQRSREIGLRMAVGADPSRIFRWVLLRGLRLTAIGLMLGAILAALATRLMAGLLYGIGAVDLTSYAVSGIVLLTVSAVACFIPAYRATRVDPMVALRID